MQHKKQSLGDRFQKRAMEEQKAENESAEAKELQLVLNKIVSKAEFLVSLRTPTVYKSSDPGDLTVTKKKPSYF